MQNFYPMDYEEVDLASNQEYRIEVAPGKKLRVMVLKGIAEVRGQELLSERWYTFSGICTAIGTLTGAKLRVDGMSELRYVVRAAMMPGVFAYFDRVRGLYADGSVRRVMVIGNGRTAFCTALANYFVRIHAPVRFTEIDPARGNIFPGVLGSMRVEAIIEYAEGLKLCNPLCLFYGNTEIENIDLYDLQIDALKALVEARDAENGQTPFQIILAPFMDVSQMNNVVKRLEVDEVVFVGDERLYHKTDLVVNKAFIENYGHLKGRNTSGASINRYFNGAAGEYTPCSFIVKHSWNVVRIGEEHAAPESALPLGGTRHVGKSSVIPTELVENAILAISEATNEDEVATAPVVGFIVCLDPQKFRVLCCQSRLPKLRYLVQGDVKYTDY